MPNAIAGHGRHAAAMNKRAVKHDVKIAGTVIGLKADLDGSTKRHIIISRSAFGDLRRHSCFIAKKHSLAAFNVLTRRESLPSSLLVPRRAGIFPIRGHTNAESVSKLLITLIASNACFQFRTLISGEGNVLADSSGPRFSLMELFRSISQLHRDFSHLELACKLRRPCGHADNSWKILLLAGYLHVVNETLIAVHRSVQITKWKHRPKALNGCVERRKG